LLARLDLEADWAAEVGAGLPGIEAEWSGFVDLRAGPERIGEIAESLEEPALREALLMLNGAGSPVYTVKCDVWELERSEIDPWEFDCGSEGGAGWASWVDVVARSSEVFGSFDAHEGWVRRATDRLRKVTTRCGRVDLVIRRARVRDREGFGITVYAAGCGLDTQAARGTWEGILRAGALATMETVPPGASSSIG
jgi:hypothetical protein